MPHHETVRTRGKITDVFLHRFVLETAAGERLLADVTPEGLDQFSLTVGDDVEIEGERKPSEVKVRQLSREGATFRIGPKGGKPPGKHHDKHHGHAPADPKIALDGVIKAGYAPIARPRRKPKHFEILAQRKGEGDGREVELHVELDGHIRKEKPGDRNEPKWELETDPS